MQYDRYESSRVRLVWPEWLGIGSKASNLFDETRENNGFGARVNALEIALQLGVYPAS